MLRKLNKLSKYNYLYIPKIFSFFLEYSKASSVSLKLRNLYSVLRRKLLQTGGRTLTVLGSEDLHMEQSIQE